MIKQPIGATALCRSFPVYANPPVTVNGVICYRLDQLFDELNINCPLRNVRRLTVWAKSASQITGNIVLQAQFAGTTVKTWILPLTAAEKKFTLDLPSPQSGMCRLVRDCADAADTLRDGTTVTALVAADIIAEVE